MLKGEKLKPEWMIGRQGFERVAKVLPARGKDDFRESPGSLYPDV
jgi:hypothetical protein